MDYNQLFEQIKAKKSFLCVGLDSDIAKIPPHLLQLEDPVFEFNKAVIDATAEVVSLILQERSHRIFSHIGSHRDRIESKSFQKSFGIHLRSILYEKVLEKSQDWGNARNMMYVVGATKAEMLAGIRRTRIRSFFCQTELKVHPTMTKEASL